MKSLKIMSIIGIVLFSFAFLVVALTIDSTDPDIPIGWGLIGLLYAIPFSIVVLVQSIKLKGKSMSNINNIATTLISLNELKEKKIITEEEFNQKKSQILKQK